MCMTPKIDTKAPIIPESVKRVAKDQRRATDANNTAAASAVGATQTASGAPVAANKEKKSLLGA